jgi:hypothetical protein
MILTGLQTLPTFKLYRDNPLRMTVNVGADFDLDGIDDLEIVFDLSARYGAQPRVSWLATLAGDVLSRDGQTIRLVADTIAVSEDDAEAALADVIETGGGSYALSIRGTMGDAPVGLALVGDLEWVGPGALTERRGAINNAVINLNVADNAISVSVAVMTDSGEAVAFDLPAAIHAATAATDISDADEFPLSASPAWGLKKTPWSLIKSTLLTYFDTLYSRASAIASAISGAISTHAGLTTGVHGLGTASQENVGAFATAAQGTKADSAVQPEAIEKMVTSNTTGITGADAITNIVSLTQAEYDAIGSKSATTLYVIV